MPTVHTPRKGSPLVTASEAFRVRVAIERNDSGRPRRLAVHHAALGEPVVFWSRPMRHHTEGLAREVLWVTDDLGPHEVLRIEARSRKYPLFQWEAFELDDRHPCVTSGPAEMDLALGHRQVWSYALRLLGPRLPLGLSLEPLSILVIEDV